jgi:hypothetical protein
MKHPHSQLIKQWLEDTTQEIEQFFHKNMPTNKVNIYAVILDCNDEFDFLLKQKPDEYELFKQAIKDGKKVEYLDIDNVWKLKNGELHFKLPIEKYRIHDPYRELKEAQASGKRVIWQSSDGEWFDSVDIDEDYSSKRYKLADDDKSFIFASYFYNEAIKIKLTKSGITGEITAEVVDN